MFKVLVYDDCYWEYAVLFLWDCAFADWKKKSVQC